MSLRAITADVAAASWEASLRWSGVAMVALLWEVAPRAHWVDATFVPPLSAVLATLGRMALDGSLASNVLVSSFRGVMGLLVAALAGVPLGLAFGYFAPRWYAVLEPTLRACSQINPFALMSIFLLFFGMGEVVKIASVAWVALWPVLFCTVSGVVAVDPTLVKCARAHGASSRFLIRKVVLPAALPSVFVGLRLGTGLVFFMLVAAEMLGASGGLGWLVHNSAANYQINGIYAGALAVIVLGYLLSAFVRTFERHLFPGRFEDEHGLARRRWRRSGGHRPLTRRRAVAMAAGFLVLLTAGARETLRVQSADQAAVGGRSEGH